MADTTITISKEELNLIMEALTIYRLKGFSMGRSSYSNPISHRDRRAWAKFGMEVWNKFHNLTEAETPA